MTWNSIHQQEMTSRSKRHGWKLKIDQDRLLRRPGGHRIGWFMVSVGFLVSGGDAYGTGSTSRNSRWKPWSPGFLVVHDRNSSFLRLEPERFSPPEKRKIIWTQTISMTSGLIRSFFWVVVVVALGFCQIRSFGRSCCLNFSWDPNKNMEIVSWISPKWCFQKGWFF